MSYYIINFPLKYIIPSINMFVDIKLAIINNKENFSTRKINLNTNQMYFNYSETIKLICNILKTYYVPVSSVKYF